MNQDFVFTQTREIIMTAEKTVTVVTEKLEKADASGQLQLHGSHRSENVLYHSKEFERRIA